MVMHRVLRRALVPLAAAGLAASASSAFAFTLDLELVEIASSDTVTDIGEKGDSLGDILTFNNELQEQGKPVGRDNGWCVRTVVGKTWECTWTSTLFDGQITVEGPFNDTGDSTFVVTGGTGNYLGASGEMKLHPRNDKGTEYDFTFHLQR